FNADSSTRIFGFDVDLRRKLACGPRYHLDLLLGYRYFQLQDTLNMTEDLLVLAANPNNNVRFVLSDQFRTTNTFSGGQGGLEGELKLWRHFFVDGSFKFAAGNMRQTVDINGLGQRTVAGVTQTALGGLYASPTNIGTFSTDRF